MENQLAPIMIGTYSRLEHLQKTVDSLMRNTLARQSELYIFSDAPKAGDEKIVEAVREYIHTIRGFKHLHIIERTENGRVANNRGGMRDVLNAHGKIIFLEDDNITAPGFLQFMNDALIKYEHSPEILNVSGYTPNIQLEQEDYDAVLFTRYLGWGVGLWKRSFEQIPSITMQDYKSLIQDDEALEKLNLYYGGDLINRFRAEAIGHLDGLDTKASFLQFRENLLAIHPKQSLVFNIGNDGSGVHSSINTKYEVNLWDKETDFTFPDSLKMDKYSKQRIADFYSLSATAMSTQILDDILSQIIDKGWTSVALWGIDVMTDLMLPRLKSAGIHITYIMDSWAEDGAKYRGYSVVTPTRAWLEGERQFAIMSFGSRLKMRDIATTISTEITCVYFQDQIKQNI